MNSDGSTPTSGRRLPALGRLTDFLRVRQFYQYRKKLFMVTNHHYISK